jgi:hypothetical protein
VSGPYPLRRRRPSRRQVLQLAAGIGAVTFWQRQAQGVVPPPTSFIDRLAAERIADNDPVQPSILIDAQTHVWWRAGGVRQMSERGEHFLKSLAGSRAGVVGHPVPIADMGRVMFLEDVQPSRLHQPMPTRSRRPLICRSRIAASTLPLPTTC